MWLSHFRSWEMVVPRNLNDSTAVTVLFMIVSGGIAGGFSWSLLSYLQFWACSAPGCCDCTRQPAAQPLVCKQTRLRPGWDRWLWCHLQTSGVWQRCQYRCSNLCRERIEVGREQPWEAPVLMVRVLDVSSPKFTSCCLSVSWSTDRWRCKGWWC